MDTANLFARAFALFVAYERCVDPLNPEHEGVIIVGLQNKSYRIRARQIMFALAYREFGDGNQEAFFRAVQEYNQTANEYLGPKKLSSTKSLRDYLKKGQAQINFGQGWFGRKTLRAYQELAQAEPGLDFTTKFFQFYLE